MAANLVLSDSEFSSINRINSDSLGNALHKHSSTVQNGIVCCTSDQQLKWAPVESSFTQSFDSWN